MPFVSGTYQRFYGSTGWTDDKNAAVFILASRHDTHDQDIADGINTAVGKIRLGDTMILSSVSGTNTILGALTPALAAYAYGLRVILTPAVTNTGATTLNIDSKGALPVQNIDGTACVGGELVASIPAELLLNSGATAWIVINPANAFDIRQNIQNSNYTFALSDRGKQVFSNTGGPFTYTIPANASVAFPIGSAIVLVAFGAGTSTLQITSDTLYWANGSGADPTGLRSIASGSIVSLLKIFATQWAVTGSGIS